MSCCCSVKQNLAPRLLKQIQIKFKELQEIYPKSNCFISKNGNIIVHNQTSEQNTDKELIDNFNKLQSAAIQFSEALKEESKCPIIHIKGENNIFSFYELGEKDLFLVFHSELKNKNFDFNSVDPKITTIIQEISEMLKGHII